MSKAWDGAKLADRVRESLPDAVVDASGTDVWIKPNSVPEVMRLLRDDAEFRFELLSSVTAVDYISYFEVVYHLTSLTRNATAVVKSKVGIRKGRGSRYRAWSISGVVPICRSARCGT